MTEEDRILSAEDVAAKLRVSYNTARRFLIEGMIPGRKIGKQWRVLESDLLRFVSEGHRRQPNE